MIEILWVRLLSSPVLESCRPVFQRRALLPHTSILYLLCIFLMPMPSLQYGCYVYGIDLSVNMILSALESAAAAGNGDKVSFEVSDATKREFPPNSFDAIFSRDAILHVADKPALFRRLFNSLKPGGKLVVSDYCRRAGSLSAHFDEYISKRGYTLITVEEYSAMLSDAGFEVVSAEDRTSQLQSCLKDELKKVENSQEAMRSSLGEEVFDAVQKSWRYKLDRVEAGEHRWGLFVSQKPL